MAENRTQFTFYESFFKAISRIRKAADRAAAYDAICAYALYGETPDMERLADASAIAFELSKPNLDASRKKAKSGKKGGENGKQTASKTEANGKQTASKKENEKENKKEKEKEDECLKENIKEKADKPPRATRFTPPTLEEVKSYCEERGNSVDPERFFDFYSSKGWMVGKNRMKDWKAAVRNWERDSENSFANRATGGGQPKEPGRRKTFSEIIAEAEGSGAI